VELLKVSPHNLLQYMSSWILPVLCMRSVLEFHVQINHPRGKAEGSSIWNVAYWQTNSRNHIELKCFVVIYVFLGMHHYTLHGNQWFGHDNVPGRIFMTATLTTVAVILSYLFFKKNDFKLSSHSIARRICILVLQGPMLYLIKVPVNAITMN